MYSDSPENVDCHNFGQLFFFFLILSKSDNFPPFLLRSNICFCILPWFGHRNGKTFLCVLVPMFVALFPIFFEIGQFSPMFGEFKHIFSRVFQVRTPCSPRFFWDRTSPTKVIEFVQPTMSYLKKLKWETSNLKKQRENPCCTFDKFHGWIDGWS